MEDVDAYQRWTYANGIYKKEWATRPAVAGLAARRRPARIRPSRFPRKRRGASEDTHIELIV